MFKKVFIVLMTLCSSFVFAGAAPKVGQDAPLFELNDHQGRIFKLSDRKDKGWTVLYFYPKAETPGCTTQACAFRDSIMTIAQQGAAVFGVSVNSIEEQKKFSMNHRLNFPLLADVDAKVADLYGTKRSLLKISKRMTFLIDEKLKIRWIFEDVDPALDAKNVAAKIAELKK